MNHSASGTSPCQLRCTGMIQGIDIIERAFQLAQSGQFRNLRDIARQLKHEGYSVQHHLEGRSIKDQLHSAIKRSVASEAAENAAPRGPDKA
jgi:hypothetical protein